MRDQKIRKLFSFSRLLVGTGPRHLSCAVAAFAREAAPTAASKLLGSGGRARLGLEDLAKAVKDEKYSAGVLNQVMIRPEE